MIYCMSTAGTHLRRQTKGGDLWLDDARGVVPSTGAGEAMFRQHAHMAGVSRLISALLGHDFWKEKRAMINRPHAAFLSAASVPSL